MEESQVWPSEDKELEQVFRYAVEKGAGFFDTAELYGLGRSESLIKDFTATTLGSADSSSSSSIVAQTSVATKFAALPWRTKREDVVAAARASAKRLGKYCIVLLLRCSLFVAYLPIHASTHLSPPFPLLSLAKGRPADLYQIHFPNAYANEAYWDGLGDAFELVFQGLDQDGDGRLRRRELAAALDQDSDGEDVVPDEFPAWDDKNDVPSSASNPRSCSETHSVQPAE